MTEIINNSQVPVYGANDQIPVGVLTGYKIIRKLDDIDSVEWTLFQVEKADDGTNNHIMKVSKFEGRIVDDSCVRSIDYIEAYGRIQDEYERIRFATVEPLFEKFDLKSELKRDIKGTMQLVYDEITRWHESYHCVHGDIKPEHFMAENVDGKERLVLIDIGLSEKRHNEGRKASLIATQKEFTPEYAAPELLTQTKAAYKSTASDYYALGITLYECLIGETPYGERKTVDNIIDFQMNNQPSPVLLGKIPDGQLEILLRGLTNYGIDGRFRAEQIKDYINGIPLEPVLVSNKNNQVGLSSQKNIVTTEFRFEDKNYNDLTELALAMLKNQQKAELYIGRNLYEKPLSDIGRPDLAVYIDEINEKPLTSREKVLLACYKISDRLVEGFYFPPIFDGTDIETVGETIVDLLEKGDTEILSICIAASSAHAFSNYLLQGNLESHEAQDKVKGIRKAEDNLYAVQNNTACYALAYNLIPSGKRSFMLDGKKFYDSDTLIRYIAENCTEKMAKEFNSSEEYPVWVDAIKS